VKLATVRDRSSTLVTHAVAHHLFALRIDRERNVDQRLVALAGGDHQLLTEVSAA